MALDIAKLGRKPYQRLERPEPAKGYAPHVERYFSALFTNIRNLLIPVTAFVVPLAVWDFGANPGYGRNIVWLALSGLLFLSIIFLWALRPRTRLSQETSEFPASHGIMFGAVVFGMIVIVQTLIQNNIGRALGFYEPEAELLVPGVVFGITWLGAMLYSQQDITLGKSLFVSWFIGSTMLVVYILARLLFFGGYSSVTWVITGGWQLLFAGTSILLLAFAMFQKRTAKLVWTISIVLHLLVLFVWDRTTIWLLLLAGISGLLLFQWLFSRKLWRKNIIYPVQISVIVFLLLVIPVKIFTGITVPDSSQIKYSQAVSSAKDEQTNTVFGNGLGTASRTINFQGVSFLDLSANQGIEQEQNFLTHGYIQLFLETGIIGVLVWVLFIALFVVKGIGFLRQHYMTLREQSMPEVVYLGAMYFLVAIVVLMGIWFTAFSFIVFWFVMILFGASVSCWSQAGVAIKPNSNVFAAIVRTTTRRVSRKLGIFVVLMSIAGFGTFGIFSIRTTLAHNFAQAAQMEADTRLALDIWEKSISANPRNQEYKLERARHQVALLESPLPIDAQKDIIENVSTTLSKSTGKRSDPLIQWRAASVYTDMDSYVEGSAELARIAYQTAIKEWPGNVALPVAIAQFYSDHLNSLVSTGVSAATLRLEAKDYLEQALAIEPEYLPARLELVFLLEELESPERARQELEPWKDASPEMAYHLGRLYFNSSEFQLASEQFSSVLKDVPNHSNARYSLGISYFRLKQYDDALTEFNEVLRLNPGNEDVAEKINQIQELIEN